MSAAQEAAPSLTPPVVPVMTAPVASSLDLAQAAVSVSLEGPARRVTPHARPAPLHLLYSVFLI